MKESLQLHTRAIRNICIGSVVLAGGLIIPATAAAQNATPARHPLVTVAWLQTHIKDPNLVLFHIGEEAEYKSGHIAGAQFPDLMQFVSDAPMAGGKDFELPEPAAMRAKLEKLGVSDNSSIVIYVGKNWVSPATRVLLTLRYMGLGDRTFLLDGGMPQWVAAGNALTTDSPAIKAGKLSERPTVPVVATLEDVKASLKKPGMAIIDARSAEIYNSRQGDEMMRAGHIPGAGNIPFTTIYNAASMVKSDAELRDMFAKAGVKPNDTVIVYCHIGQQATTVVMAATILGYNVRLYDGSFHEWSFHKDLPVEITSGGSGSR
jgi:thiosulfate/3-mercaptopyruvate sulfurtransferase